MRNFGLGDIAMCAGGAAALIDEAAAFEVVDFSRLETVLAVSPRAFSYPWL